MAAKNKSNEIYITRIYDAPVKAVWEAWVDPDQVSKWWGPRGFTLTHKSGKDVRPGGTWEYIMHGPDGVDYPNAAKFLEVEKHSRLVYDHGGTHDKPAMFRVTVLFTEIKGKTKMEMTMALKTAEEAEQTYPEQDCAQPETRARRHHQAPDRFLANTTAPDVAKLYAAYRPGRCSRTNTVNGTK